MQMGLFLGIELSMEMEIPQNDIVDFSNQFKAYLIFNDLASCRKDMCTVRFTK